MEREVLKSLLPAVFLFSFVFQASSQQPWIQMYPGFATNHYLALLHWNGDTVFAAGTGGMFRRSTDGGSRWQDAFPADSGWDFARLEKDDHHVYLLPVPTWSTLSQDTADISRSFLFCYSVEDGTVSRIWYPRTSGSAVDISVSPRCITIVEHRNRATLVQSTDRGATWTETPIPDSLSYSLYFKGTAFFPRKDTGIFLGWCDRVQKLIANLTTDGGRSWTSFQDIEYPMSGPFAYHRMVPKRPGMWFDDSSVVLIGDGMIPWFSTNCGISWRKGKSLDYMVQSIVMNDHTKGYCVGLQGEVSKTTDAWGTHDMIRSPLMDMSPVICSPKQEACIIAGEDGLLFTTTDQGTTWNDLFVPEMSYITDVEFFSPLIGACTFTDAYTRKQWYARTYDGGAHWSHRFELTEFWHIKHASSSVAYGFTARPLTIYRTTDEGYSWVKCFVSTAQDSLAAWTATKLTRSVDTFFVVSNNKGILFTADRGTTWMKKPSPPEPNCSFDAGYGNICWALGSKGLYRSMNDGDTWTKAFALEDTGRFPPTYHYSRAVSEKECYVLTSIVSNSSVRRHLYHTTNGGESWSDHLVPIEDQIPGTGSESMYFSSGLSYGFIPGTTSLDIAQERFCKTENYWESHTESFSFRWNTTSISQHLFFLDQHTGWIILRNSIYRTTNGGVNWTQMPLVIEDRFHLDAPYPNPITSGARAVWSFANNGGTEIPLRAVVSDMRGVAVATVYDGIASPGITTLSWNTIRVARGVYYLTVSAGKYFSVKAVVVR